MSTTTIEQVSVRPFAPDFEVTPEALTRTVRESGAALLTGWSDDEAWTVLLPWPEEIRRLPWSDFGRWRDVVRDLERASGDPCDDPLPEAPFLGGWIGFLSYELGAVEEGASLPDRLPPEPPLFFARHRSGLLRSSRGMWLFGPPASIERYEARLRDLLSEPARPSPPRPRMEPADSQAGCYRERVELIREAIARGDVYQVNLTRRFETATVDPVDLYHAMTGTEPPRCSAFLRGDGWTIVSASPEVFLTYDRRGRFAESRPIKGTVSRAGRDQEEIAILRSSEKDAAEHLMIVDLVRNDLGKVAPPGGVSVPSFRTVRTLASLYHLESTVRADGLDPEVSLANLLGALFPAGSITGAPKRAAVAMIRELEPVPRGVYTGAIGFLDRRGRTELSVAIRTAVVTPISARYHAGGGIVWESNAAAEEDESIAKSSAFLRFVEEPDR